MLWLLGASLLLVFITSSILFWGTVQVLHFADDQVLKKRAQAMRLLIQDGHPDEALIEHEVDEELEGPRQILIRVTWPSQGLMQETQSMSKVLPAAMFPDVSVVPAGNEVFQSIGTSDGRNFRALAVRIPVGSVGSMTEGIIQVATETTLDAEMIAWYKRLLAGVTAASALACLLGCIIIVRRELQPLRAIAQATSSIGVRNLDYRVPAAGLPDEIEDLANKFNDMLGRLERSYDGVKHYADNIAHELRGPVNRMLLECEVALLKSRSKTQYKEALEANVDSCRQLREIVQSLLFLARADSKRVELLTERLSLNREFEDLLSYFEASAAERGVALTAGCDDDTLLEADRTLLRRAMSNLISNAITHTPSGGKISITGQTMGDKLEIRVTDSGEGIAPEHLPYVFDRFYRADDVRCSTQSRVGLGLSITKSIVELHGGSIGIESEPGRGTTVFLAFPCRAVNPLRPFQNDSPVSCA